VKEWKITHIIMMIWMQITDHLPATN